jgi:NTE family protein
LSQHLAGETPAQAKEIREQVVQEASAAFQSRRRRHGLALCLSGGGYRAALYHLGALRRLDEVGALARVDTVSSVSGGSIIAAYLADRILSHFGPAGVPAAAVGPLFANWDNQFGSEFRKFARRHDIRTGPLLERLRPGNWLRPQCSVLALAALYERHLTGLRLADLPQRPHFVLCATDMVFGVNWVFERGRVGSWQAGYARTPAGWPLGRAVAASSCFPPLFPPLPVGLPADSFRRGAYRGPGRRSLLARVSLTDGGVYDNLGLEPVWKGHRTVLVSDGGGRLDYSWTANPVRRISRYASLVQSQAAALRTRWLGASLATGVFRGAYWGIAGSTAGPGGRNLPAGSLTYARRLAMSTIATVRTDLDRFTDAEVAVLENHGYLSAAAALAQHAPELLPAPAPAVSPPHETWMDEARVADALRDSSKRFSWRRWMGSR